MSDFPALRAVDCLSISSQLNSEVISIGHGTLFLFSAFAFHTFFLSFFLLIQKGNTALHISSLAGQAEVVKILVKRGADINAQSQVSLHCQQLQLFNAVTLPKLIQFVALLVDEPWLYFGLYLKD